MKNTKLKMQDIVVYGLVSGLGLVFVFILMFTDLFFSNTEESAAPASSESNFNKINPKVKSGPVAEHESKVDLYDEELYEQAELEKRLQERNEQSTAADQRAPITDLSRYLKPADTPRSQPIAGKNLPPSGREPDPRIAHPAKKNLPSVATKTKTAKRSRRADPTFGEEISPANPDGNEGQNDSRLHAQPANAFSAIIQGEQVVKEGSRMTIRITEAISIGSCSLSANARLTGIVSIQGQRIYVRFIICPRETNPIQLSLFDTTDGVEGLYVESLNVGQELKKEAVGDAVGETANRLGIPVVDKIARSAGSKKLDTPSVTVQSGTRVSLKAIDR